MKFRTNLVEFIVELRQRRAQEFLPERSCGVPVEVDVGHRVDGVVAEGPQVIRAGVRVREMTETSGGRVQARLAPHRVSGVRRGVRRAQEVHRAEPAPGLLAGGGPRWSIRHRIHLEAALRGPRRPERGFLRGWRRWRLIWHDGGDGESRVHRDSEISAGYTRDPPVLNDRLRAGSRARSRPRRVFRIRVK